jgi:hypothetical protein
MMHEMLVTAIRSDETTKASAVRLLPAVVVVRWPRVVQQ